jgi:hypothetical protein
MWRSRHHHHSSSRRSPGRRRERQTHLRIPATQSARAMPGNFRPENRGRGECRVLDAPAAARVVVGSTRVSHHEYTGEPGIPARDGVNGFLRALPSDRALLSPSLRETSAKLDTSVEASEPHDFAVRIRRSRQQHHQRPPHPAPTSVTIASAPQMGRDSADYDLIWVEARRDLFLAVHLDAWNRVDRAEEIRFCAQAQKAAAARQAADSRT